MLPTKVIKSLKAAEAEQSPKERKVNENTLHISMAAIKKSREPEKVEDKLPVHIKQLKVRIEQLKVQIEEQQQKLKELEQQTNLSGDAKDKTRELYQQQLVSLQLELASTMKALGQAIKDEGIEDPAILIAALMN